MEEDEGSGLQRRREGDDGAAQKGRAKAAGKWLNGIARFETSHGVVWKIRYRVPLGPDTRATRQQVETLTYCGSRREAESVLALRRAQVFDQTYRPRSNERPPTLADYAVVFLQAKSARTTAKKYESMLRLHLLPRFGRRLLDEIEPADCDAYRAARIEEGDKPKTVKNELDCLSTLYKHAINAGKAKRDPTANVDHGKIDNKRERLLSRDELGRLLAALSEARGFLPTLFVVLYYTGLRLSDACSLSWDRINFEAGWLSKKQGKTGEWVYPPMHPALARALRLWRAEVPSSKWVFPQQAHPERHISRHAVKEPWAKMLERAGVENLWRHDMRRLLVTSLSAAGVSKDVIGLVSGHLTAEMVERYIVGAGPLPAELEAARAAVGHLPDLKVISEGHVSTISDQPSNDEKANNSVPKRDD